MEEHLKIIQQLADGIDPITGEIFDNNHILQNAVIVRALATSVKAIENEVKKKQRKKISPNNAGQPWTEELDENLIDEFKSGKTIKELSEKFKRTEGSIQSRLLKHHHILDI
jgi:hypothetical protein